MNRFYYEIKDRIQGKATPGMRRSSKWRKVRGLYIEEHNECFVCKLKTKLEIHHLVPFHIAPHLELDIHNLMTLCENKKWGINCHLLIGHLGNYQRVNINCELDAFTWRKKLEKECDFD